MFRIWWIYTVNCNLESWPTSLAMHVGRTWASTCFNWFKYNSVDKTRLKSIGSGGDLQFPNLHGVHLHGSFVVDGQIKLRVRDAIGQPLEFAEYPPTIEGTLFIMHVCFTV